MIVNINCSKCGQIFQYNEPATKVKCPYCGEINEPSAGYQQGFQQGFQQGAQSAKYDIGVFDNGRSGRSRGIAALLAIFLGAIGIHYFYLGKNTAGIVFLLISLLSCGTIALIPAILAFVQAIIMLTLTQDQFEAKYIYCNNSVPLF